MQPISWPPAKKKMYYALALAVAAVCIIGTIVWKNHNQPISTVKAITPVRTQVIETGNNQSTFSYSGEVRGRYESQLAFQATGKLMKRNVQLGSLVQAGDILMQIDPRDLQQTVNSTSAQRNSAESQFRLAQSNLTRYRQLYEQNAISRAQLDQYESAYEVAQAAVQQASAQYAQGSNQLDYSVLRAEKSGVISGINAETGQIVSAGTPVLTIVENGEREIEISVPENRIEELRKNLALRVSFWALPTITLTGSVREVAPMADAITRTYKVRISLVNPPPEVKLGMTASVTVLSGAGQTAATTFSIPLSAIYQTGDTPCVWVVVNHTVALRPIKVGSYGKEQIEVLSGLNPGEIIVTAGVHTLQEGQEIKLLDGDGK